MILLFLFGSNLPQAKLVNYKAYINAKNVKVYKTPSTKYKEKYVLTQRFYPLKVIGEFDNWCRVVDFDGTKGWIKKSNISTKKLRGIITKDTTLFRSPDLNTPILATIKKNVLISVEKIEKKWVYVKVATPSQNLKKFSYIKGWVKIEHLWF